MDRKDLVFENVHLLKAGHNQPGILKLGKHHATFTYDPEDNGSSNGTRHSEGSASVRVSRESSDSKATARTRSSKLNSRTRDYWIPYPLVNHCTLHPNPSQSTRIAGHDTRADGAGAVDEEFPPVYGTNAYARPSTDSTHLAPYSSPQRPSSPGNSNSGAVYAVQGGREPRIRIRQRNFQMVTLLFYAPFNKSAEENARDVFYALRSRCCVERVQKLLAFSFKAPKEEIDVGKVAYDARREFARMGVGAKAAEGPGSAWRITNINHDYTFSPTYPNVLCVPRSVSDNMLKYGGPYRSKCRIPALTYLHFNGGSITRSSQPMPGFQGKRNPQDERLVSAIFASHTPSQQSPADSPPQLPTGEPSGAPPDHVNSEISESDIPGLPLSQSDTALDESAPDKIAPKKIYGSTRRNVIADARPKINAIANRAGGGGFEDVSNYGGNSGMFPERHFLNIPNIHVMRKSLDKVIEGLGSTDLFSKSQPDSELLRKSGWLGHIAGLLEGGELVTRIVGLGGGHVLVHCSDGWDRTSQVAAIAEVMLDPFYRTLQGFITLVQKDFLAFGHKFNERMGILGCEKWFEIENEQVAPSRPKENNGDDPTSINALGSKALSGAKNWFEKSRGNLFRQQNDNRSSLDGTTGSRPPSPPLNPLIHAPATTSTTKDRECKVKENEIAPIFHQFLDAVFQLQAQFPNAFEFNERFLRRLFYQAHVAQYGEFLFDTEKERAEEESHFSSVWPHFLSRRREFVNPHYVAKEDDPLLFPRRNSMNDIDIQWWSALFGQELNTPQSLARPDPEPAQDPPSLPGQSSTASMDRGTAAPRTPERSMIKEARSMPSFSGTRDDLAAAQTSAQSNNTAARPAIEPRETSEDVLAKYAGSTQAESQQDKPQATAQMEADDGDPLGVSGGMRVQEVQADNLDYAAFARGSAYSDR